MQGEKKDLPDVQIYLAQPNRTETLAKATPISLSMDEARMGPLLPYSANERRCVYLFFLPNAHLPEKLILMKLLWQSYDAAGGCSYDWCPAWVLDSKEIRTRGWIEGRARGSGGISNLSIKG